MSAAATATPSPDAGSQPQAMSTEQKILVAAQTATSVVSMFSKPAAEAIQAGVAVEPIVKGLILMFSALFTHHVNNPKPQ